MNLFELRTVLSKNPGLAIELVLPDQSVVPEHFHITEVGRVKKDFIDCGGTVRSSASCVLQVWVAGDVGHRLDTSQVAKIIGLAPPNFLADDLPVEVEYDNGVISQYPVIGAQVTSSAVSLKLGSKHTACLAVELCIVDSQSNCGCGTNSCC